MPATSITQRLPFEGLHLGGGWRYGLTWFPVPEAPGQCVHVCYVLAVLSPNGKHAWPVSSRMPLRLARRSLN